MGGMRKVIRCRPSHFTCAENCGKACHIKPDCSRISRAVREGATWYCSEHSHPSQVSLPPSHPCPQPHQATPSNATCPKCNSNIKQNPMICTRCNTCYHQSCSGLPNRYAIERSRPSWLCETCLNPSQPVPQADVPATAQSQSLSSGHSPMPLCPSCKSKVKKGFLTCNQCDRVCHQADKCSDLPTRGARESAMKNND